MTFGEGYTSRVIHNITGFGFNVCPECHQKESEEEEIFRRRCENAAHQTKNAAKLRRKK